MTQGTSSQGGSDTKKLKVGIIGARGYVGRDLLELLEAHPRFSLVLASSRQLEGEPVFGNSPPGSASRSSLKYCCASPDDVVKEALDVVVLALPNGMCAPFVAAFAGKLRTILLDLSADYRFDEGWTYGSPERNRALLTTTTRIANPGCYATAMQLLLAPFVDFIAAPPSFFGVSGYSGAGTSPSRSNDLDVLQDNLLAYQLAGHLHEREVAHQLHCPLHFSPHVAAHFRGIHITAHLPVEKGSLTTSSAMRALNVAYENSPFVEIGPDIPELKDIAGTHLCRIGGVQVHGDLLVGAAVVDNLLKGAASQALQNLNLACGFQETLGLVGKSPATT